MRLSTSGVSVTATVPVLTDKLDWPRPGVSMLLIIRSTSSAKFDSIETIVVCVEPPDTVLPPEPEEDVAPAAP